MRRAGEADLDTRREGKHVFCITPTNGTPVGT
jgi:hypothetical protein